MPLTNLSIYIYATISLVLTYINSGYSYTQEEINNAYKKMMKKEVLYKRLHGDLGCWPNGVVPYTILPGFSQNQIQQIMSYIYQIQNRTCVRWLEKSHTHHVQKHVQFFYNHTDPKDCKHVELGNEKAADGIIVKLYLGDRCFDASNVLHEMVHALGFGHEHSRLDRDCYVAVNEMYTDLKNFKITYDDTVYEKWPYDKRSIVHYTRRPSGSKIFSTEYIIKDKDEPFGGLIYKYRLGDSHGWWGRKGYSTGRLTFLDTYKINYKFCGAPDFCDTQPKMCKDIEEEEKWTGCKQLYEDIVNGKAVPTFNN